VCQSSRPPGGATAVFAPGAAPLTCPLTWTAAAPPLPPAPWQLLVRDPYGVVQSFSKVVAPTLLELGYTVRHSQGRGAWGVDGWRGPGTCLKTCSQACPPPPPTPHHLPEHTPFPLPLAAPPPPPLPAPPLRAAVHAGDRE
jgi:hypothetical protein